MSRHPVNVFHRYTNDYNPRWRLRQKTVMHYVEQLLCQIVCQTALCYVITIFLKPKIIISAPLFATSPGDGIGKFVNPLHRMNPAHCPGKRRRSFRIGSVREVISFAVLSALFSRTSRVLLSVGHCVSEKSAYSTARAHILPNRTAFRWLYELRRLVGANRHRIPSLVQGSGGLGNGFRSGRCSR